MFADDGTDICIFCFSRRGACSSFRDADIPATSAEREESTSHLILEGVVYLQSEILQISSSGDKLVFSKGQEKMSVQLDQDIYESFKCQSVGQGTETFLCLKQGAKWMN